MTLLSVGSEASALVVTLAPGLTSKPDGTVTPGKTWASAPTIAPGMIVAPSITAFGPICVTRFVPKAPMMLGPRTVAPKPIDTLSPMITLAVGFLTLLGLLWMTALSRTLEPLPILRKPEWASSVANGPTKPLLLMMTWLPLTICTVGSMKLGFLLLG